MGKGKGKAHKSERKKDRRKASVQTPPLKQFSRKKAQRKDDPIVLSDDDEARSDEGSHDARHTEKGQVVSLIVKRQPEGRWEDSSDHSSSSRQIRSAREDSIFESEVASQDSGDSWRPETGKAKPNKAQSRSPSGSVYVNPVSQKKGKKQATSKSLRMPPAELQLEGEMNGEHESNSGKKARPGSSKGKRKGGKRQTSDEPDVEPLETAQPASALEASLVQAANKKSPYFAAAAPSQANDKLKSFKKVKLAQSGSKVRENPADSDSAELATSDLGIASSGDGGLHKHATAMVSPRSRTAAGGPEECYICEKPRNQSAAAKASSPASASVQFVASSPSPQPAEQEKTANNEKTPQKQSSKLASKRQKRSPSQQQATAAQAVSASSDRVGDWDPEGEARAVSSQAEASLPKPSSIVVEANDSPRSSQGAEQQEQLTQKAEESPQEIIPDTQQENSAGVQQGSVSLVRDTPEKESWATGEGMTSGESQGYQPGSHERDQEGISAEKGAEQPMATPSRSKQKEQAFEAELNAFERCNDSELKSKLPQMVDSQETLALVSPEERRQKISTALEIRNAERPSLFRKMLNENMDKRGAARKERQEDGASAVSPLAARETQPKRPRKHTEPTAPAKKLTSAPAQPADMKIALWEPPVSPYFLIEEVLYNDPWKLLVACMLLNKTTGRAVRKILYQLFELCPTPEAAIEADTAVVEGIIRPLGLFRKRALMFKRFSREYIEKQWTDPRQLHGMGQYAADAFSIFCRNEWKEMKPPQDKDLLKYYEWLKSTDGQGSGFQREIFAMPSTSQSTSLKDGQQVIDICSPAVDSKAKAAPCKQSSLELQ